MCVIYDGSLWTGLFCVSLRTIAGFCEAGHNSWGSILRGGKSVALLSGQCLRKRDSVHGIRNVGIRYHQAVRIMCHKYSFRKNKSMWMK